MQQVFRLAQHTHRRPFPTSFFTSRAPSQSSSASQLTAARFQPFSDSSKSKPPSKNAARSAANAGSSGSKAASSRSAIATEPAVGASLGRVTGDVQAQTPPERGAPRIGTEIPASITPIPILATTPPQICIDNFYAGDRPLLEVTLAPVQRRSPSSAERKYMEIVGELVDEESDRATGWKELGEYDSFLITEPGGPDAGWGKGVDRYLASLDHNVLPPSPKASTSSPPKSAKAKPSKRQQNIDYMFPYQAERRKQEQEEKLHFSHLPPRSELWDHPHDRAPPQSIAGTFLTSHLVKNQWKSAWDWEKARKALDAAEKRALKGKGKAVATDSLVASIDRLRNEARALSRNRARARRSMRNARGIFHSIEDIFGTNFQVIHMDAPSFKNAKELKGKKSAPKLASKEEVEEVRQVLDQVHKFTGFFDKSSDFSAVPPKDEVPSKPKLMAVHVDINWDGEAPPEGTEGQLVMLDERTKTQSKDLKPARPIGFTIGSRLSYTQASRGRMLRRPRSVRLALRGVEETQEDSMEISLDSVKRKRKKRITKHKYRKRRKATRAQRRSGK